MVVGTCWGGEEEDGIVVDCHTVFYGLVREFEGMDFVGFGDVTGDCIVGGAFGCACVGDAGEETCEEPDVAG